MNFDSRLKDYYDFVNYISIGGEVEIVYRQVMYYISQNRKKGEIYFTLTEHNYKMFRTVDELLSAKLLDNQTLYQVWGEITLY